MKNFLKKFTALPAVVAFMLLCMSMTSPIESGSILSESHYASKDFSIFMVSESWTWTDFGAAAFGGLVGGAAGGAVVGAVCGAVGTPIASFAGAGAGAAMGALGGTVGGAVGYAATQAWDAVFGSSSSKQQAMVYGVYTDAALD